MMVKHKNWMLIAITAAAFGCSGPGEKPGTDTGGWDLGDRPDSGADVGGTDTGESDTGTRDGGSGDGGTHDVGTDVGEPPEAVTFRLTNNTNMPVFAEPSVGAGAACGLGSWVEVLENGEPHRLSSSCLRCACDDETCAVCDVDCAPGVTVTDAQLGIGESRVFEWDGLFRVEREHPNGGACDTTRPPAEYPLRARFCWATAFEPEFDQWGELSNVECTTVEFDEGDRVVEAEVIASPREPVRLEMTNSTDRMLYAHIGANEPVCDTGAWLTLRQDGQTLDLGANCGTCFCSEVDEGANDLCDQPCPAIACAQPTIEAYELPPGSGRMFDWNRVAHNPGTVDGQSCERRVLVGGEVTAQFCWGESAGDPSTGEMPGVHDPTCETITFDPHDDSRVAYEISDAP